MRRWVRAATAAVSAAACGGAIVACGAGAATAADGLRNCIVSRLSGAGVQLETGGIVAKASLGAAVPLGAIIETRPDARAEITCDDGVTVTVGAGSRVDLGALAGPTGEDQGILMRLFGGIVGINAPNRTWGSFEVETDLAIASVRSTAWLVETGPGTGTGVFVHRGRVEVRAGDDRAVLAEGEGVDIPPAEGARTRGLTTAGRPVAKMKPVVTWGPARLKAADVALGLHWTDG
jgi:ferric-dicitrate binding protein FerR (iron transport regulator)